MSSTHFQNLAFAQSESYPLESHGPDYSLWAPEPPSSNQGGGESNNAQFDAWALESFCQEMLALSSGRTSDVTGEKGYLQTDGICPTDIYNPWRGVESANMTAVNNDGFSSEKEGEGEQHITTLPSAYNNPYNQAATPQIGFLSSDAPWNNDVAGGVYQFGQNHDSRFSFNVPSAPQQHWDAVTSRVPEAWPFDEALPTNMSACRLSQEANLYGHLVSNGYASMSIRQSDLATANSSFTRLGYAAANTTDCSCPVQAVPSVPVEESTLSTVSPSSFLKNDNTVTAWQVSHAHGGHEQLSAASANYRPADVATPAPSRFFFVPPNILPSVADVGPPTSELSYDAHFSAPNKRKNPVDSAVSVRRTRNITVWCKGPPSRSPRQPPPPRYTQFERTRWEVCPYRGCGFSSHVLGQLARHKKGVHKECVMQCTNCGANFQRDYQLQDHLQQGPKSCERHRRLRVVPLS